MGATLTSSLWPSYGVSMPTRRLVAIHQFNSFPWLGYFDEIGRVDVFILLDNVQFPKTGGTWVNRLQWLVGGKGTWVTAPIVRAYHGVRDIQEMRSTKRFHAAVDDWTPDRVYC